VRGTGDYIDGMDDDGPTAISFEVSTECFLPKLCWHFSSGGLLLLVWRNESQLLTS